MNIEKIYIQNFKNFSNLEVNFSKGVNLFVGGNCSGKTSILEAINVILGSVLKVLNEEFDRKIDFHEMKITKGIREQVVKIQANLGNSNNGFKVTKKSKLGLGNLIILDEPEATVSTYSRNEDKLDSLDELYKNFNHSKILVPLIAYYSTQRLFKDDSQSPRNFYDPANGKLNGYIDCLKENSIQKILNDWLGKAVTDRATLAIKEIDKIDLILENVEAAIRNTLIEFLDLPQDFKLKIYLDSKSNDVFVNYDNEHDLPLSYYSDGFRNLIYLVFDMVWRASQLNPWMTLDEITKNINGVVTIDEIDLHLHPKWQAKAIDVLQKLFPEVQFFVTTHSPTVVANFEKGTLYVINDNKIEKYAGKYFAREINDVLIKVLGASDRHKPTQNELDLLFRLIDDRKTTEYKNLLIKLTDRLGEDDFDIIKANTLIEINNEITH